MFLTYKKMELIASFLWGEQNEQSQQPQLILSS
jgi:hypothetical protein